MRFKLHPAISNSRIGSALRIMCIIHTAELLVKPMNAMVVGRPLPIHSPRNRIMWEGRVYHALDGGAVRPWRLGKIQQLTVSFAIYPDRVSPAARA